MYIRIRVLLLIKVSATIGIQTLQAVILSLHASILNVHGPPRVHFEPASDFDFNGDPDPAFHSNASGSGSATLVTTVKYKSENLERIRILLLIKNRIWILHLG
jgi:hypothetical protein